MTAPPVLSPLLTMTEAQYAHDHTDAKGDLLTVLHRLIRAHREIDAQRTRLAKAEQREFVFLCPHCGDPFAATVEPSVDIHSGATYRCDKCDGKVIFTAQTPDEYVRAEAAEQDVTRLRAALEWVEHIVEGSEPSPPGGQHVGPTKYSMSISTRKELRQALRAALAAPDTETSR